jgi:hypothetical protein
MLNEIVFLLSIKLNSTKTQINYRINYPNGGYFSKVHVKLHALAFMHAQLSC